MTTTLALATKVPHAVQILEFASEWHRERMERIEATMTGTTQEERRLELAKRNYLRTRELVRMLCSEVA
jgi:hypothetical protein